LALVGLAAAALLVLAISRYRVADVRNPVLAATVESSHEGLFVNDVFRTGAGERNRVTLANGVELRLDADTQIRFAAQSAVALERGTIFVDSGPTHLPARSVEIRTALAVARDIGTRFEVRVTKGATRVRVREGMVQLSQRGAVHMAARGVELIADASGVARHEVSPVGEDWNWITAAAAPFDVEGKTLPEFLDWVGRESGWQIRFADETLRESTSTIVLHGSISGLSPGQALDTILPTCGLAHRVDRDVVTIRTAARAEDRR
jgi:ferric-dicitrate binding protein FerR (iron transport regulator)